MHTRPDVHALELKIPPVALVIIIAILMGLGAAYFPGFNFQFPFQSIVGWMIGLLGVIACTLGILEFKRAKTTLIQQNPNRLRHWSDQGSTATLAIQCIWASF